MSGPFGHVGPAPVHEIMLRGPDGMEARILTWGAVIRDLTIPHEGARLPLVLGFDDFAPYPTRSPYFGAVVGRYANRIAEGRFVLDGAPVVLDRNEGSTTLHGGSGGFAHRIWRVEAQGPDHLTLSLASPDGDQGFPGRVEVRCTYRLLPGRALEVAFHATADRPTPVNLAQHSYFNLDGGADVTGHRLTVHADAYTPVDARDIPTGEIAPVEGTPFDLRHGVRVGDLPGPLDHNFVLRTPDSSGLTLAAELRSPLSGVRLRVRTTKPGLQAYDGHKIALDLAGSRGRALPPRAGLCLEAQSFPDGPNHPAFPDTILRPGETYAHRTLYAFDRP